MKELFEHLAGRLGIQSTATTYTWGYAPNGRLRIEFLKDDVSVLTAQTVTYQTWRITNPSNSQTLVVKTEIWPDELEGIKTKVSTFPSPSGEGLL